MITATTTPPKRLTQIECVNLCREFIGPAQMHCMIAGMRGEERQHFVDKFREYAERITNMPKTYETEGMATDEKTAWLHYFTAGTDAWIVEKDVGTPDEPGQHQAYGFVCLNGDWQNAGFGYVSIVEMLANRAELDLYWKPATLAEIKLKHGQ